MALLVLGLLRSRVLRERVLGYPVIREPLVELLPAVRLSGAVHPRRHPLADDAHMLGARREGSHEVVGIVSQDLERLVEA